MQYCEKKDEYLYDIISKSHLIEGGKSEIIFVGYKALLLTKGIFVCGPDFGFVYKKS